MGTRIEPMGTRIEPMGTKTGEQRYSAVYFGVLMSPCAYTSGSKNIEWGLELVVVGHVFGFANGCHFQLAIEWTTTIGMAMNTGDTMAENTGDTTGHQWLTAKPPYSNRGRGGRVGRSPRGQLRAKVKTNVKKDGAGKAPRDQATRVKNKGATSTVASVGPVDPVTTDSSPGVAVAPDIHAGKEWSGGSDVGRELLITILNRWRTMEGHEEFCRQLRRECEDRVREQMETENRALKEQLIFLKQIATMVTELEKQNAAKDQQLAAKDRELAVAMATIDSLT